MAHLLSANTTEIMGPLAHDSAVVRKHGSKAKILIVFMQGLPPNTVQWLYLCQYMKTQKSWVPQCIGLQCCKNMDPT